MKIKIKNKWSEVTLKEFIKIAEIEKKYTTELKDGSMGVRYTLQRDAEIIALLSGESIDDIMDLPHDEVIKCMKAISFLQSDPKKRRNKKFSIDGKMYGWVENFNTLTMGEKVSVEQAMVNAMDEERSYIPDILAILVREYKDKEIEKFDSDKLEDRKKLFMDSLTADKFINELNFILATANKSTKTTI